MKEALFSKIAKWFCRQSFLKRPTKHVGRTQLSHVRAMPKKQCSFNIGKRPGYTQRKSKTKAQKHLAPNIVTLGHLAGKKSLEMLATEGHENVLPIRDFLERDENILASESTPPTASFKA